MHLLRRHPRATIAWIVLILSFLITRFHNLLLLPIFTDEAIYIYWAKFIAVNHSNWFISLADGKPPLLIWSISLLLTLLPHEMYLFAGRLPSVFAGLLSLVGIFLLTKELVKSVRASYIAAALYLVFPFTLLYDRMALFDSMLQSMLLLATYFAIRTARTLDKKDALAWGLFLGLAILSKPTALLFVFLTPLAFLLLTRADRKKDFKKILSAIGLALIVSQVLNNLQRVSDVYDRAALKNAQFQQPIDELIKNPLGLTIGNMHGIYDWIVAYYSYPFLIFGIMAFGYLIYKNWKAALILITLWFIPLIALATVGREIFPRYILFTTPYFLIVVAYLLRNMFRKNILQKSLTLVVVTIILFYPLKLSSNILTDPTKAALAKEDKEQYVSMHPAGYGVKEVIDRIDKDVANGKKVTLVTQGTFGLFPYAFTLKYWDSRVVTILPRWPLSVLDQEIYEKAESNVVYILFKEHTELPKDLPLTLLQKIPKPGGSAPLLVAELKK